MLHSVGYQSRLLRLSPPSVKGLKIRLIFLVAMDLFAFVVNTMDFRTVLHIT
jgi:hypothetical protein